MSGIAAQDPVAALRPHAAGDLAPTGEFLSLIPRDFARRHLILSAGRDGETELLLAALHSSPAAVFNTGVRLGRPVRVEHRPPEQIAAAIDQAYDRARNGGTVASVAEGDAPQVTVEGTRDIEGDLSRAIEDAERDLLSTSGKAPSVRLVDLVLFEAILRSASDVHIQPLRDRTLVRYRLDGALHTVRELPANLASSVVSRIKVMARLDVAERRAPQDGRATVTIGGKSTSPSASQGRRIDLRISTLPSTYGERVVLRLLDPTSSPHLLNFAALGMPPVVEQRYLAQVARTSGIVLSTGPTGSGKTTTLYTTLAWLNSTNTGSAQRNGPGGLGGCELNMMTVEDPVEYDLSTSGLSVSQTQVDPKKNVTFAAGLRHILRQDPDVIMVGEIRDEETARIAVQASLTGHLVLSTLHTSDSAGAVARLLDLGVEPFLVASSLSAVLAQRLLRRRHYPCEGAGCEVCFGTGFKGRMGIFELLVVDPPIRDLVGRRASALEIKAASQRGGMRTLAEAGFELVKSGQTSREEVLRVVDATEELET